MQHGCTNVQPSNRVEVNRTSQSSRILSWEEIYERLKNPIVLPKTIEMHLIRHAESEINAQQRITGSQDVKLTLKGKGQARKLGLELDKYYDIAFASGLNRAQETLALALQSGNVTVTDISNDCRLNERGLGVLEGEKRQVVLPYATGDLNYAPLGGESYKEVARRILSFLENLASYALEKEINQVLVCGHMGPMRIMAGIIEEQEDPTTVLGFSFSNAEVVKLNWDRLLIPEFLQKH